MTINTLRQRDVYSRIYVSPREVDQCVAKRKASPGDDAEYDLAHILVAVPASATPRAGEERVARAQGIYERARAARTSRSSRSPTPTPARPSRAARSAGARATSCRRSRQTRSRACSRAR